MPDPRALGRSKLPEDERALARRLRSVRVQDGFSIRELAARSGVSAVSIQAYEEGRARLPFKAGSAICHSLDVSQSWLATGDGDQRPFMHLSGLSDDPLIFKKVERQRFSEAFLQTLRDAVAEWRAAHPIEKQIAESIKGGAAPAFRKMSRKHLEAQLASFVSELRATTETALRAGRIEQIKTAVAELEKREPPKKVVDEIPRIADMTPMEISEAITRAVDCLGVSQAEAAKRWGVSRKTLENWIQGRNKPRGLALVKLTEILRGLNIRS